MTLLVVAQSCLFCATEKLTLQEIGYNRTSDLQLKKATFQHIGEVDYIAVSVQNG